MFPEVENNMQPLPSLNWHPYEGFTAANKDEAAVYPHRQYEPSSLLYYEVQQMIASASLSNSAEGMARIDEQIPLLGRDHQLELNLPAHSYTIPDIASYTQLAVTYHPQTPTEGAVASLEGQWPHASRIPDQMLNLGGQGMYTQIKHQTTDSGDLRFHHFQASSSQPTTMIMMGTHAPVHGPSAGSVPRFGTHVRRRSRGEYAVGRKFAQLPLGTRANITYAPVCERKCALDALREDDQRVVHSGSPPQIRLLSQAPRTIVIPAILANFVVAERGV